MTSADATEHTRTPDAAGSGIEATTCGPRCGELVVVKAGDVTRIVCVTEIRDTHLVAVLTSNEIDMATDYDIVVHRSGTYDVLLIAECYLDILKSQVVKSVGTVDEEVAASVRRSVRTDSESVEPFVGRDGYTVGLPLGGANDPRRKFREQELTDIVALRGPAHRLLFGDR